MPELGTKPAVATEASTGIGQHSTGSRAIAPPRGRPHAQVQADSAARMMRAQG